MHGSPGRAPYDSFAPGPSGPRRDVRAARANPFSWSHLEAGPALRAGLATRSLSRKERRTHWLELVCVFPARLHLAAVASGLRRALPSWRTQPAWMPMSSARTFVLKLQSDVHIRLRT